MGLDQILALLQTALELGLISSLTVLALFLSYSMLNVCDLSTDGCFTLGAVVGAAANVTRKEDACVLSLMLQCGTDLTSLRAAYPDASVENEDGVWYCTLSVREGGNTP